MSKQCEVGERLQDVRSMPGAPRHGAYRQRSQQLTSLPLPGGSDHEQEEIHKWLNKISGRRDFGARFEQLAWEHRIRG